MAEPAFLSRPPSPALRGLVSRIAGYCAKSTSSQFVETAELVVPVVFNLGVPWQIRLGKQGEAVQVSSFAAGLYPGPVAVSCEAGADLLQVDLTPYGAVRLFGGAAADLASRVVELSAVDCFDGALVGIHDRLHSEVGWPARFDLVERLLLPRFRHPASRHVQRAWQLLAGGRSVADTANVIGWSPRHLSTRFRQETGLRPVTAARMLRFQRARACGLEAAETGWAAIAAETGYADQAHLIGAFQDFAGESPTAWAGRAGRSAPRLPI